MELGKQLSVLVIDDEAEGRLGAFEILEAEGFLVATAEEGELAVNMLQMGLRPDVILMDVMMPGLDGYETLTRIRRLGFEDLPVVMLTSMADDDDVVKGYQQGADFYLTKHGPAAKLVATVRYLADRNPI